MFLYTCVRNASLTFNSTRKRHREAEVRLFAGQQNVFEESDTAVQLEVIRAELLGNIYREIELLPKNCRVIVKMIFLQGKRTDQIAAELGISSQTVRSQKSRGIRLLKTQLFRRPQVFSIVLIILGLEYISIEI
ncbi:MAG TPA: sigma factor-like helix-turn-helix DNA-binding protein [Flavitalea sp.]|nr:sigma factor-like helix-turn-helix DNA-binding protein [Flavitalea sp.]